MVVRYLSNINFKIKIINKIRLKNYPTLMKKNIVLVIMFFMVINFFKINNKLEN